MYRVDNSSGTLRSSYRYRAWGDRYQVGTENYQSRLTYKGAQEDRETGLVYMRHRYYSPRLERFLNEDPIHLLAFAIGLQSPVMQPPEAFKAGTLEHPLEGDGSTVADRASVAGTFVASGGRAIAHRALGAALYCYGNDAELNAYVFAMNDPMGRWDPMGLNATCKGAAKGFYRFCTRFTRRYAECVAGAVAVYVACVAISKGDF